MTTPRLLAFAQLLRLPNVFTAFADILMAVCAVGTISTQSDVVFLLLGTSGCLYLFGMVLNDICDVYDDEAKQSFRPLPSKRIGLLAAILAAVGLLIVGLLFAGLVNGFASTTFAVAAGLAMAIVLYNWLLKHFWIGPVAMGSCRFLNVLLGSLAFAPDSPISWHLASVIGLYIVGVTLFARTEEGNSRKIQLIGASIVMLLSVGLAVAVPVHRPAGESPVYFPYLLVLFGFVIGTPIVAAIRKPTPKMVQAAVKRSIFGLVLLDAILATAFVGWPGLLIVLLLLPAIWLGKWVYST